MSVSRKCVYVLALFLLENLMVIHLVLLTRNHPDRRMNSSPFSRSLPGVSRLSARHKRSFLVLVAGASGLLVACSSGPTPLSPHERADIRAQDRTALLANQEPVQRPITLFDAMARALKYNLEHRVALMEKAVSQKQLTLAQFQLMPPVNANVAWKKRSSLDASSGLSVTPDGNFIPPDGGAPSYSSASDEAKTTADLTMAWNLLDFGVSAIEARQESDRVLIARENQRKVVHSLLQKVRATFWKAVGTQRLDGAIVAVLKQARQALKDARRVERERLKPLLEILRYQKTLMEIVRQLQDLRHQLSLAKTEFASLINLPPGTPFTLAVTDDPVLTIPTITMGLEEMEQLALDNRPELRQKMYEARILRSDVRKAMLRLLPSLTFQVSENWDDNSFALFPQWQEAGAAVAWNIWKVLQAPATMRSVENRRQLADMRRMTKHMAILAEVHLAYRRYLNDQRKLRAAEALDGVDRRILKNIGLTSAHDAQNQLAFIGSAAAAIMTRLQLYQAYADAQNAVGLIYATLGVDLTPKAVRSAEIPVLAEALREAVMVWNQGASGTPLQHVLDRLAPDTPHATHKPAVPAYFFDAAALPGQGEATIEREAAQEKEEASVKRPLPQIVPVKVTPDKMGRNRGLLEGETALSALLWRVGEKGREPVEEALFATIDRWLRSWADAWSKRETERFFAFYDAQRFLPPRALSWGEWRERMGETLRHMPFLQIDFGDLKVTRERYAAVADTPEGGARRLYVTFRESYRSRNLHAIRLKAMIVEKGEAGWIIVREGTMRLPDEEDLTRPPGYAIQVARVNQLAKMATIRDFWQAKGFHPVVIEQVGQEKNRHYSIRVAYFKDEVHATLFRWFLQLEGGFDSQLVDASEGEMQGQQPDTQGSETAQQGTEPSTAPASPASSASANPGMRSASDDVSNHARGHAGKDGHKKDNGNP